MVKKKHPPNWVRHYRKEAGLSSEALAELVDMSPVGLRYIEKSERILTLENAKKIAGVLNVNYWDIIDGPAAPTLPENESQKKLLEGLQDSGLSEREQELYVNAFLSGLKPAEKEQGEMETC